MIKLPPKAPPQPAASTHLVLDELRKQTDLLRSMNWKISVFFWVWLVFLIIRLLILVLIFTVGFGLIVSIIHAVSHLPIIK